MGFFKELRRRAGQVIGPVAGISMVVYFAYHAVQGNRGFIQMGKLDRQVSKLSEELQTVRAQRMRLQNRVQLLNPGSLDPDMLEERARLLLGYGRTDEWVIMVPKDEVRPLEFAKSASPDAQMPSTTSKRARPDLARVTR